MKRLRTVPKFLLLLLNSKNIIQQTQSFTPTSTNTLFSRPKATPHQQHASVTTSSSSSPSLLVLSAVSGKKRKGTKKLSASERRKRRGRKTAPPPKLKPHGLPRPDVWDPTTTTTTTTTTVDTTDTTESITDADSVKAEAKALIDVQRKSVETLTHVKERIESLSTSHPQLLEDLTSSSHGYYTVVDDFLGTDLHNELREEGRSMLREEDKKGSNSNKMELDMDSAGGILGGEYTVSIVGGEEQYVDCPRCVEYVVSLTRHIPASLDGDGGEESIGLGFSLENTGAMARLRSFDRNARRSALELLGGGGGAEDDREEEDTRPFRYVVDGTVPDDRRKITTVYFMVPDGWTDSCGGGIRIKVNGDQEGGSGNEVLIGAKKDRLVVLRSDLCMHRMEKWIGSGGEGDGLDVGSCIEAHFVQR